MDYTFKLTFLDLHTLLDKFIHSDKMITDTNLRINYIRLYKLQVNISINQKILVFTHFHTQWRLHTCRTRIDNQHNQYVVNVILFIQTKVTMRTNIIYIYIKISIETLSH